ncbi:MAG: hypothetical protein ACTS4U_01525 [Candidatus Hodgkinia cicadicola]
MKLTHWRAIGTVFAGKVPQKCGQSWKFIVGGRFETFDVSFKREIDGRIGGKFRVAPCFIFICVVVL